MLLNSLWMVVAFVEPKVAWLRRFANRVLNSSLPMAMVEWLASLGARLGWWRVGSVGLRSPVRRFQHRKVTVV